MLHHKSAKVNTLSSWYFMVSYKSTRNSHFQEKKKDDSSTIPPESSNSPNVTPREISKCILSFPGPSTVSRINNRGKHPDNPETSRANKRLLEWSSVASGAAPTGQRDWNWILAQSGSVKGILWVPDTAAVTASKTSGAA